MGQAIPREAVPFAFAASTFAILVGGPPLLLPAQPPSEPQAGVALLAVGALAVGTACVLLARAKNSALGFPWVSLALMSASLPLFVAPSTIQFNPRWLAFLSYVPGAIGVSLALFEGRKTKKERRNAEPTMRRRQAIGLVASLVTLVVAAIPIVDIAADHGAPATQEGLITDAELPKHAYDPYVVAIGELRFKRSDPMPRVRLGDRVRVVIRPGALGLAWVGDLERLKRAE